MPVLKPYQTIPYELLRRIEYLNRAGLRPSKADVALGQIWIDADRAPLSPWSRRSGYRYVDLLCERGLVEIVEVGERHKHRLLITQLGRDELEAWHPRVPGVPDQGRTTNEDTGSDLASAPVA